MSRYPVHVLENQTSRYTFTIRGENVTLLSRIAVGVNAVSRVYKTEEVNCSKLTARIKYRELLDKGFVTEFTQDMCKHGLSDDGRCIDCGAIRF